MYNKGDTVMHPGAGVCKIHDIRKERFPKTEPKLYYVLKPVYDNGATTIYLPADENKITLRKLLSADDIKDLIHSISLEDKLWVDDDNERQEKFMRILRNGDHANIIKLIAELHTEQTDRASRGKKLHIADDKVLHEAEKLLHQEFAYTLKLDVDEVAPFIIRELGL